jgi:hypothetical protein
MTARSERQEIDSSVLSILEDRGRLTAPQPRKAEDCSVQMAENIKNEPSFRGPFPKLATPQWAHQ